MPFRNEQDHFKDILQAIAAIEEFTKETPDLAAYSADLKTTSAVERQLQILTEAAYRLGTEASAICPGPDWSGLRGMGNIIRHAYHRVEDRVIWAIHQDLPELKRRVTAVLADG